MKDLFEKRFLWVLAFIQKDPSKFEEIKLAARQCLAKLYKANTNGLADRSLSQDDLTRLSNYELRGFVKVGSRAEHILFANDVDTFAQLIDSNLPSRSMNVVLKAIPINFRVVLIEDDYEYRAPTYGFLCNNRHICLLTSPTKRIQLMLKSTLNRISAPRE